MKTYNEPEGKASGCLSGSTAVGKLEAGLTRSGASLVVGWGSLFDFGWS